MSQEIINVLNYLGEQLGIAIDWSAENVWPQVLDVLGRYRLFELVSTGFWIFLEIIMVIVTLVIFKKTIKGYIDFKKNKESNFWWNKGYYSIELSGMGTVILIVGILIGLVGGFTFLTDISELLKWIFVPEIEYLEMLKGLVA